MAKKKILFINQEISPYVPDNAMSVMGRELPRTMQDRNHEIRTFMPKWGNINERRGQLHEVIRLSGINLIIDDTDHPLVIKVASIPSCRVQVYFIDNDDYFSNRQMTVDENGLDYPDNGERAIFFARGVLETVKKQCWVPDIIHCQGWMSGVVPFYIKTAYKDEPSFANTKVVTSLFNNFEDLGKLAIDYSDGVILADKDVSKTLQKYAKDKNIPTLGFQGEEFGDAYEAFYDQISPEL